MEKLASNEGAVESVVRDRTLAVSSSRCFPLWMAHDYRRELTDEKKLMRQVLRLQYSLKLRELAPVPLLHPQENVRIAA